MRVKHGDIYVLRNPVVDERAVPGVLQRLVAHDDIPVKQAYWIAKFARKANDEIVLLEEQVRALWRKYGTEQDGQISIEVGENRVEFEREYVELMNMETDLDVPVVQIPDNINIPLGDLMLLDPFIEVVTV